MRSIQHQTVPISALCRVLDIAYALIKTPSSWVRNTSKSTLSLSAFSNVAIYSLRFLMGRMERVNLEKSLTHRLSRYRVLLSIGAYSLHIWIVGCTMQPYGHPQRYILSFRMSKHMICILCGIKQHRLVHFLGVTVAHQLYTLIANNSK